MRKALLIIAVAVLVLVPVAAFAIHAFTPETRSVRAYDRTDVARTELTEQQQADLEDAYAKMLALRKETINTMQQDGLLTEEEAALALERLDQMAEYHAENGFVYGYGMMNGCYGDYGYDLDERYDADDRYYGRGMMGGYGSRGWN